MKRGASSALVAPQMMAAQCPRPRRRPSGCGTCCRKQLRVRVLAWVCVTVIHAAVLHCRKQHISACHQDRCHPINEHAAVDRSTSVQVSGPHLSRFGEIVDQDGADAFVAALHAHSRPMDAQFFLKIATSPRNELAAREDLVTMLDDGFMCQPLVATGSITAMGSVARKVGTLVRSLSPRALRRTESPRVAAFRPSPRAQPPAPPHFGGLRTRSLRRTGSCAHRRPFASLLCGLFPRTPQAAIV